MEDINRAITEPQGLLRAVTCLACIMGSIGGTPGLKIVYLKFSEAIMQDIAIAGGAVVAITLLLAMGEDNKLAEFCFTFVYFVLTLVALILFFIAMSNEYSNYNKNIGFYIYGVCIIIACITWFVDFIVSAKKYFS